MGLVWLARHEALGTHVALKVIHTNTDPRESTFLNEKLQQEARIAVQLDHPAVVRTLDSGVTKQGHAYLVMELVEGDTLDKVLAPGRPLPAKTAVRLLLPIADALAKAHRRGIVHRDLKPDNILLALTDEGVRPKLIDFGVAKLLGTRDPCSTAAGTVLGSPGYLSPEQARGLPAGPAADVWGLCIVLYEMVTGCMAFDGDEPLALIAAVVRQPHRSVVELGVDDRELSDIIDRGMRKAPKERWGSIEELGVALADWLWSRGVTEDAYGMSLDRVWLRRSTAPPPPEHWEHALRSDPCASRPSADDWGQSLRANPGASFPPPESVEEPFELRAPGAGRPVASRLGPQASSEPGDGRVEGALDALAERDLVAAEAGSMPPTATHE
jgi:serine/threonine-protein kinase